MVVGKTKKMPKGVGKRIIETLKNRDIENETDEISNVEFSDVEEIVVEIDEIDETEESEELEEKIEENQEIECEEEEVIESEEKTFSCAAKPTKATPISDIDTLLNLISKLPSGVTKQTGALIIRQTMEAMGISMNNVLSNAQSVQEGLENSIRNNVNIIEEYRTKIKILEQEIQKFRKKAHELEDVISLFILSEDKK